MKMIVLSVLLVGVSGLRVYAQRPDASVARVDPARTEGAIIGGLRWLAERQIQEGSDAGSWPVAIANYRPAIASLAGLAFLANGHLPGDSGPYGELLAKTLKYVMGTMANDGYLGQGDRSGMYIHAISTLFGLSCLGMQQDETVEPELADWCRRSLESIIRAQQVKKEAVAQGGMIPTRPIATSRCPAGNCWCSTRRVRPDSTWIRRSSIRHSRTSTAPSCPPKPSPGKNRANRRAATCTCPV